MNNKILYSYIVIVFSTLLFSFFFEIDISSGGASKDLKYHWNYILGLNENLKVDNCSKNSKNEAIQNLSRRIVTPLYIPLVSIITSFLLIYKKEKTYHFLRKYVLFILSFTILILAEILLKYTGLSLSVAITYFAIPIITTFFLYICLQRKMTTEKIIK